MHILSKKKKKLFISGTAFSLSRAASTRYLVGFSIEIGKKGGEEEEEKRGKE